MKIALCFWGLTRSLKHTIQSIRENILKPLEENEIEYTIFLHTYQFQSPYINPRANEVNVKLDFNEYSLLRPDFVQIDDQDEIKKEINLKQYHTLPDPWDSNYICLDNFVCAMYSKKQLGIMVKESQLKFDYIVYLRPDVKYINKFDTRYFNITTPKHVCIPNFHLFPKLNDRLCILTSCNLEDYCCMFNDMYKYSCVFPLHSESFQYYMITKKFQWSIRYIPIHFNRVRANGFELPDTANYYKILHKKKSQFNKIISNASPKEPIQLRPKKTIQPLFKTNNKDN